MSLPLMTFSEEAALAIRINDMAQFANLQLYSRDIDPVYPVLRGIIEDRGMGKAQAFWLVELYLAYYNLPSALTAFREQPWPELPTAAVMKLPTGVERRGLRDVRCMEAHLRSYLDQTEERGGPLWAMAGLVPDGLEIENFHIFWDRAQTIEYNGRWAAFKWTELLVEVLDFPFEFPDMRLKQCSGPREGLAWVYGAPEDALPTLEECAKNLRYELRLRGVELTWERLETVLCDYNSMRKGHYYAGHDIDQLQEQMEKAAYLDPADKLAIMKARRKAIPREYLGEWNGWAGVDRERRKAYRDTGNVLARP